MGYMALRSTLSVFMELSARPQWHTFGQGLS